MRTPVGVMLALTAAAACSTAPATSTSSGGLALLEELRIGGLDGDVEYTFGSVTTVAPAPDGSVYIADRQGPVVRRYGADGTYLSQIGRSGEGPGEYTSVDGLGVTESGELAVYDGRVARVTWFSESGDYLESHPITGGVGAWRGFVVTADGGAFLRVLPESGFSESAADGLTTDWVRVSRDGAIERLWPDPPEQRVGPRYVVSGRGGMYRPFVTMNLSAMGPDGAFYTARNDLYRIAHRAPSGDETLIVRNEEPVALSPDEKREWGAYSEAAAGRPGADRSDFFPIPDPKPFLRELAVDMDDRLWASRYTEAVYMPYSDWERADRAEKGYQTYEWRDVPRWDVFDATDEYLGSVVLPFKTTFVTATGDEVWGIQAGDYNEDYVVKWRIGPSPAR